METFHQAIPHDLEIGDLQVALDRCRQELADTSDEAARKIYESVIARYEAKIDELGVNILLNRCGNPVDLCSRELVETHSNSPNISRAYRRPVIV